MTTEIQHILKAHSQAGPSSTDVYARRILGRQVPSSKTTDLVAAALQQARFTRRRTDSRLTATDLVHQSDGGGPVSTRSLERQPPRSPGQFNYGSCVDDATCAVSQTVAVGAAPRFAEG